MWPRQKNWESPGPGDAFRRSPKELKVSGTGLDKGNVQNLQKKGQNISPERNVTFGGNDKSFEDFFSHWRRSKRRRTARSLLPWVASIKGKKCLKETAKRKY